MNSLLNADTIKKGGGLLIALAALYVLYKILSNDLPHIEQAILKQAEIQQQTNNVLREQTRVLEGLQVLIRERIR